MNGETLPQTTSNTNSSYTLMVLLLTKPDGVEIRKDSVDHGCRNGGPFAKGLQNQWRIWRDFGSPAWCPT